jgi:hypothetical protein
MKGRDMVLVALAVLGLVLLAALAQALFGGRLESPAVPPEIQSPVR